MYDPSKDSTLSAYGGSGTHRIDDPDTWEWSDNWALTVLDYLINPFYGVGAKADTSDETFPANEIDWESFIDAVKDSNDSVSKGANSPDDGTQKRYTVNGVFETDATPISTMESLLASGAGKLFYRQGKYALKAGKYKAPASSTDIINEDMILSTMQISAHTPRSDLFNKVSGIYIDKGYDDTQPISRKAIGPGSNYPSFEGSIYYYR